MRTRHISSSDSVAHEHRTVLLHEAIDALDLHKDDVVVDGTLGGGGHARQIANRLGPKGVLLGFDLDEAAIERSKEKLKGVLPKVFFANDNFRHLTEQLQRLSIPRITKALFDLGWSSYQLDSGRGFSFNADEPLHMTYGVPTKEGLTAATIVNTWSEKTLADIFYAFGEEKRSRQIARAIVERRSKEAFTTAKDLAATIEAAVHRTGKIHPATKTFQALRIAVNDELGSIETGVSAAWNALEKGGRIAVITFHSVEDRLVKHLFASWARSGEGALVYRKPLTPSKEEVHQNPRSRSAKLRVIEKIYARTHTKDKQIRSLDISGED